MENDKEKIYTFEISGEEESRGVPIPKREIPAWQATMKRSESNYFRKFPSKSNNSKLEAADRKQLEQNFDVKRYERLRKLYDSMSRANRGAVMSRFVMEGRKMAEQKEEAAAFVPFQCYWPSYDVMSEGQKKWYLYWRELVRSGEYPDTDLSYIFLYIYEVINNIGIDSPISGFMMLCRLWSNYRKRYPSLDNYMVTWLQDLCI